MELLNNANDILEIVLNNQNYKDYKVEIDLTKPYISIKDHVGTLIYEYFKGMSKYEHLYFEYNDINYYVKKDKKEADCWITKIEDGVVVDKEIDILDFEEALKDFTTKLI